MAKKPTPIIIPSDPPKGIEGPPVEGPENDTNVEFADFAAPPPPPKSATTVLDIFRDSVSLVSQSLGYREVKLRHESSAVKLYELALMWALNNRDQNKPEPAPSYPDFTPDEYIDISSDTTEPQES